LRFLVQLRSATAVTVRSGPRRQTQFCRRSVPGPAIARRRAARAAKRPVLHPRGHLGVGLPRRGAGSTRRPSGSEILNTVVHTAARDQSDCVWQPDRGRPWRMAFRRPRLRASRCIDDECHFVMRHSGVAQAYRPESRRSRSTHIETPSPSNRWAQGRERGIRCGAVIASPAVEEAVCAGADPEMPLCS